MQQRKHNWLGHVLRHDGMLLTILEEGQCGQGIVREDKEKSWTQKVMDVESILWGAVV